MSYRIISLAIQWNPSNKDNMGPPMAVISIVLHWGCNCTFTEQHVNKILTALHVKLVASTTPHLQVIFDECSHTPCIA